MRHLVTISVKTKTDFTHALYRCGGSILSENWVLSAGHCCAGLGTGDIVAGGIDIYFPEGVEQHRTPDKFRHPDYDSATINNDVCLLKVGITIL